MGGIGRRILMVAVICSLPTASGGQGVAVKRPTKALTTTIRPLVNSISVQLMSLAEGVPFTGGGGGSWDLDFGTFSYTAMPRKTNAAIRQLPSSVVVSSEFGVQITSSGTGGTATLLAVLQSSQPKYAVRIDGILLESIPVPVAPHLRTGIVSRHRIEVELPVTLTEKEGSLSNTILFSVVLE
jgi:hypothetical protein